MKYYVENLTRVEQLEKILELSEWYSGRDVDIAEFEHFCLVNFISFFPEARKFLREFSMLENVVYVSFKSTGEKCLYDYNFHINAPLASKLYKSKEYKEIIKFAGEACICVGLMGYYYPGVTAIGKSGKIYINHDYSDTVNVYDSFIESIDGELRVNHDIVWVADTDEL